ncbi:hypothetical protein B0J12DRAFT_231171 [Macrophomina phaseolina]|uniref:Uncharacterized protein n=1 Tax=Macrophomina phaseolina TaxID=35725 RepID=A0ABQ8GPY4_9PEZI|nr:hypothetical protein B0J12DRAFT_231171 [Macrophomina phaseolina]
MGYMDHTHASLRRAKDPKMINCKRCNHEPHSLHASNENAHLHLGTPSLDDAIHSPTNVASDPVKPTKTSARDDSYPKPTPQPSPTSFQGIPAGHEQPDQLESGQQTEQFTLQHFNSEHQSSVLGPSDCVRSQSSVPDEDNELPPNYTEATIGTCAKPDRNDRFAGKKSPRAKNNEESGRFDEKENTTSTTVYCQKRGGRRQGEWRSVIVDAGRPKPVNPDQKPLKNRPFWSRTMTIWM